MKRIKNKALPLPPSTTQNHESPTQLVLASHNCLTEATLFELNKIGHKKTWPANSVLLSRGTPTTYAFVLLEGKLRGAISSPNGEEQFLGWLLPGEITGLSSVVGNAPYPVEVISCETSVVLHLDQTRLLQLIENNSKVAIDLIRFLSLRVNTLLDRMSDQGYISLEQKITHTLQRLANSDSEATSEGRLLKISQSELANAVVASRPRVNQQLMKMQDQGLLRLGYRSILILAQNSI